VRQPLFCRNPGADAARSQSSFAYIRAGYSPAPLPQAATTVRPKTSAARRASCGIHEAASRRPIAMAPASAIPAATLPAPSGSTPAPIASSLPQRQPVVTTRTMPQPTRTDRWLAQVTTPSDGLPDPSSCWTAQYGPSTCPLPAGSVQSRAAEAHLRAMGQGSSRWIGFQQEAPSTPMPRAAVASSKANGMKREWCPESLVVLDTLRRSGRTETLTGQASHTSSRAKGRNKGATNG